MEEAVIDAVGSGDEWTISYRLGDIWRRSDLLTHEEADHRIGGWKYALERLDISVKLGPVAAAIREWWATDRFVLVYDRYGREKTEGHPTLGGAWRAMASLEDHGAGSSSEIQDANGRTLYRCTGICTWERIADDAPPLPAGTPYVHNA